MKKQYHEARVGKVTRGTGAKRIPNRDKKLAHAGGYPALTVVDEKEDVRVKRTRGGKLKYYLKKAAFINISMPDGSKKRVRIKRVIKGNNPDFTRQNIITKGAILETEVGKVVVTNRPGQEGLLNGKLINE